MNFIDQTEEWMSELQESSIESPKLKHEGKKNEKNYRVLETCGPISHDSTHT